MKRYQVSEIPEESWKALYDFFWGVSLACLPRGSACDAIFPEIVETTKRGLLISCEMLFLPSGSYRTSILLARPRFSSIPDFTPKKLEAATVLDSSIEDDGSMSIRIG